MEASLNVDNLMQPANAAAQLTAFRQAALGVRQAARSDVGQAFISTFGKMGINIVVERLVYCIIPICLIVSA